MRPGVLPVSLALFGALPLGAMATGCGPSIMKEPTEFTGDDTAKVGVLCSGTRITKGDKDFWVKFLVIHAEGWQAAWADGSLQVDNGVIRRRAAGNPREMDDGTWRRFETYFVEPSPDAGQGETVTVGPLRYGLSSTSGGVRDLVSATCEATIK
jgi:hypothetical protein